MRVRPWLCMGTAATVAMLTLGSASFGQSCPSSANDCCAPGAGPGCSDIECCDAVCAQDPFCCNTAWDGLCANQALTLCAICAPEPCDNPCPPNGVAEAEPCGGDTNGGCNGGGVYEDITPGVPLCGTFYFDGGLRDTDWFKFNVGTDSEVTLSVSANYPVLIGLLSATCDPIIYVLENATGCPATVTACVPAGDVVAFVAPQFLGILNCGDAADSYVALVEVGAACSAPACGNSDNDCCAASPNGTPFCSDEECCNAVCAFDGFCCNTAWDGICASEAAAICTVCGAGGCDTTCPPNGVAEAEPCGGDTNGGCNGGGVYEDIALGTPVCGSFFFDGALRDTDWFRFNLAQDSQVTLTVQANYPVLIGLLSATCDPIIYILENQNGCGATVTACIPAGDQVAFVAPQFLAPLDCSSENSTYVLNVTVGDACTAPVCGGPDTGDCCVADGTPFCNDAECCEAVCAIDPFCCNTAWDTICADEASQICELCGGGGSNCCFANGGQGCDDPTCEAAVCAADPFCCNTAWDGICADEAATLCPDLCGGGGGGPPNDNCDGALPLAVGANAFNTTGATGATALPGECLSFGSTTIFNDVFYTYTATATGTATISTCNTANFDTRLAVFEGDCANLVFVACNDDGDGCAGFTSEVSFNAECGETYIVVVGAFGNGVTGNGTITVSQTGDCPSTCCADLNGDGVVGGSDLTILLAAWGTAGPGDCSGDGVVGGADLTILLAAWGPCP